MDSISRSRNKGVFISELVNDYIVFDLETTGLSPDFDEIIEFSGFHINDGKVVDQYSTLIKPLNRLDPFITELTGITNEMLENQPSLSDVIGVICDYLGDSILLGHNIHFDLNFLYDAAEYFLHKEITNDFVDLLRVSRKMHPEWKSHTLSIIANNLSTNVQPTHRAGNDALATYQSFEIYKQAALENGIDYEALFSPKSITANDIVSRQLCNGNALLCDEEFVFTGKLDKMERVEAWQLVVDSGGKIADGVTKKTNYLVLGNLDYTTQIKNGKSNKLKKAEELILKGQDLKILTEDVFYDLLHIK